MIRDDGSGFVQALKANQIVVIMQIESHKRYRLFSSEQSRSVLFRLFENVLSTNMKKDSGLEKKDFSNLKGELSTKDG